MTEKCKNEGCQIEVDGQCAEHKVEVERRKSTQKMVQQLQNSVTSLAEAVEHLEHYSQAVPRLNKLFVITTTMSTLILAGLTLSFIILQHQDTKFDAAVAVTNQQAINRTHLLMGVIEKDRDLQVKLVGMVEGIQVRYEMTSEKLEILTDRMEELHREKK